MGSQLNTAIEQAVETFIDAILETALAHRAFRRAKRSLVGKAKKVRASKVRPFKKARKLGVSGKVKI